MSAAGHTTRQLATWRRLGVERADLAVRRTSGAMIWHRDLPLDRLPLGWARAENVRRAEVYVRPARGEAWPIVFLDDVAPAAARRLARHHAALLVSTSREGGFHVWLATERALAEAERAAIQRRLAYNTGADLRSTSGEHLGRLAGFKNWKRGGCWVNVAHVTDGRRLRVRAFSPACHPTATRGQLACASGQGDTSPSGRDWAWACAALEHGEPHRRVRQLLAQRARDRRGNDAERYARVTVQRALLHVRRRR